MGVLSLKSAYIMFTKSRQPQIAIMSRCTLVVVADFFLTRSLPVMLPSWHARTTSIPTLPASL
jgi:hypothetical protein